MNKKSNKNDPKIVFPKNKGGDYMVKKDGSVVCTREPTKRPKRKVKS